MVDDPFPAIAVALAFGIPALVLLLGLPQRRRQRARDRAEDVAREALCRQRGWTFRRQDLRDPQDRLGVWQVDGTTPSGRAWTLVFRHGSDLVADSGTRPWIEYRCALPAAPGCAFVLTDSAAFATMRGRGMAWLARAASVAGLAGPGRHSLGLLAAGDLVALPGSNGLAVAAEEPALAAALASDASLREPLQRLAAALPPVPREWHLAWDDRGLHAALRTDFLGATAMSALVDTAERAAAVAAGGDQVPQKV